MHSKKVRKASLDRRVLKIALHCRQIGAVEQINDHYKKIDTVFTVDTAYNKKDLQTDKHRRYMNTVDRQIEIKNIQILWIETL